MSGAPLGFQFCRDSAASRFNGPADFIETDQRKGIVIKVFKAGKYSTPHRRLISEKQRLLGNPGWRLLEVFNTPQPRRVMKADAAFSPFAIFGGNIFSDKNNLGRPVR